MYFFTYNDYQDLFSQNDNIQKVKTKPKKEKINSSQLFIHEWYHYLAEPKEVLLFLNQFINLKVKNLDPCDLVLSRKLLKKISNHPMDQKFLYTIISKQVLIYIKLQTQIDYQISYYIWEDSMQIMRNWEQEKQVKAKYPIIIPIIIYTGKQNWSTRKEQNPSIKQISRKENRIDFAYNLIDTNQFSLTQLSRKRGMIAKLMMLEKQKI